MMNDIQDVFTAPQADTVIWRFMDFTRFVAMLEHSGLFFVRASKFDDPFEGSYPKQIVALREDVYRQAGLAAKHIEDSLRTQSGFAEWNRHWVLINSWHMNNLESAAMWKLYATANEAIAIKSTYSALRACLPGNVQIGVVRYIDYTTEWFPDGNILYPYIHKRRSFAHEQELRAVLWDTSDWKASERGLDFNQQPAGAGKWIDALLSDLISEVCLAPASADWFEDLVRKVVTRYGLAVNVVRSSLEDAPFF